ncbi:hypothetical protein F5146DRAFT_1220637 [Armillaria mellea]|nr:hypothetical protein F5146DRAFT_1220637 [Armillaria mellea]
MSVDYRPRSSPWAVVLKTQVSTMSVTVIQVQRLVINRLLSSLKMQFVLGRANGVFEVLEELKMWDAKVLGNIRTGRRAPSLEMTINFPNGSLTQATDSCQRTLNGRILFVGQELPPTPHSSLNSIPVRPVSKLTTSNMTLPPTFTFTSTSPPSPTSSTDNPTYPSTADPASPSSLPPLYSRSTQVRRTSLAYATTSSSMAGTQGGWQDRGRVPPRLQAAQP